MLTPAQRSMRPTFASVTLTPKKLAAFCKVEASPDRKWTASSRYLPVERGDC